MSGSPPAGDALADIGEVVLRQLPTGVEAIVAVTWSRLALTRFANSRIHQNIAGERVSVRLKLAQAGRVASAQTNRTSAEALSELVGQARAAAEVVPLDAEWPGVLGPAAVPTVDHWDDATAPAEPAERAAAVSGFVAAGGAWAERAGAEAAGYCDSAAVVEAVLTSAGQRAVGRFTRASVDGIFLCPDQGGFTPAGYGHATSVRLADLDGAALGAEAARSCGLSQSAVDIEPGEYAVVLRPEAAGEMVSFLAGYGFNAKEVLEGSSFISGPDDLASMRFDPSFRLWDDVSDPRSIGLGFDADGTPRQVVSLIEGGRCAAVVHDRRTARRWPGSPSSTGHAHQWSDAWGPAAANLVVGPPAEPGPDLVTGVERGLLVTCFNYVRVLDPKTVGVTGLTRNGVFLVEDGKVVRPVTNLRFTQSILEALAPGRVLGIGSDARFADVEDGTGRVIAPSLHLAGWRFTGGASG